MTLYATIDVSDLVARRDARELMLKSCGQPVTPFEPWLVSPRPEWHGKEVKLLSRVNPVFLFEGDELKDYKLIHPKHLTNIRESDH